MKYKVLLYLIDLSYSVVSEEDHRWIRSEDGSRTRTNDRNGILWQ